MTGLVAAVFVASLLGSLHCVGMCGPLLILGLGGTRTEANRWTAQAAYHGGRLVVYTLLGMVAGAVGAVADLGGARVGLGRVGGIVAGLSLIVIGAITLARALGVRIAPPRFQSPLTGTLDRVRRALVGLPGAARPFGFGLVSAFLPCGWLWAFVAAAAGAGSAAGGALAMIVFWTGTVPALAIAVAGLRRLASPLDRRAPALAALALVVIGLFVVATRIGGAASADVARAVPTSLDAAEAEVRALTGTTPPCCRSQAPEP